MFRSATTTLAPSRLNRWQIALPMPDAPPVTIATLFSRRLVKLSPLYKSLGAANQLAAIVAYVAISLASAIGSSYDSLRVFTYPGFNL